MSGAIIQNVSDLAEYRRTGLWWAQFMTDYTPNLFVDKKGIFRNTRLFLLDHPVKRPDWEKVIEQQKINRERISLPFETVWFESCSQAGIFEFPLRTSMFFGAEMIAKQLLDMGEERQLPSVVGLHMTELAPDLLLGTAYLYEHNFNVMYARVGTFNEFGDPVKREDIVTSDENIPSLLEEDEAISWQIKYLLSLIQNSTLGSEKVKIRVKLGKGKDRKTLTRKTEICHVYPKNVNRSKCSPFFPGKTIDWSHRFEVRGHWRKINGLGKDRRGVYCVKGFTWVADYVKGPEEKPLIVKKRILHLRETQGVIEP